MKRRKGSRAPLQRADCTGTSFDRSAKPGQDRNEAGTSPPWLPFPDLARATTEHDDIMSVIDRGSATADYLWLLAMNLCGTGERAQLQARLDVLYEKVATRMASNEAQRLADLLGLRRPITAPLEIGTTYIYFCLNEPSETYPLPELLASLALWLLAESRRRLLSEPLDAMTLQTQAGLCLTFALGREAASASALRQIELAQEARRALAIRAAHASHRRSNERKEKLLSDYEQGNWQSIPQAAMELAPKHHFSMERVIRFFRGVERNRDPALPSPIRRRKSRRVSESRDGALQPAEL
jgi:hypothetical protein